MGNTREHLTHTAPVEIPRPAILKKFVLLTKFSDRMNKMHRIKRGILFSEPVLNPVNPVHPVRLFLIATGRAAVSGVFNCVSRKKFLFQPPLRALRVAPRKHSGLRSLKNP
ncbi:MAG: hypothetical protein ABSH38_07310 [Verrucomicrobiota bacterium]|jgi:hypothetical protein